jgi:hypothetical protein
MLLHPCVQPLLTWVREGVSATASDPTQLDCELVAEQTAERSPQRRASCVSKVVGRHTLFWIPIKYWTFIILVYPVIGTLRDLK